MRCPSIPRGESERLRALAALEVLDTEPEPAFDALVRLVAIALDAPMALVSFVDRDRQWFKARYGVDLPHASREESFCGHVVADDAPLVVPDALDDERFFDNPMVVGELGVRFYAGMPLRMRDGSVLGALCAIDRAPREPTAAQLEALALLAEQVVAQLEARRARRELAAAHARAEETARQLASVFEAMAEGVVVHDQSGAIVRVNGSALAILGRTEAELVGANPTRGGVHALHADGTPMGSDGYPVTRALRTGHAQTNVVLGLPSGGDVTWLSVNAVPRVMADGTVTEVVTTFHDVTTLRMATQRLHEQERLAMAGTLAAGVGHEINTPLAYLSANLDFVREELQNGATLVAPRLAEVGLALADARTGADRIGRIVRGLRALSREDVALGGVDVGGVIDTALSMAGHELRRVTVHVDPIDTPPALADESRLTQVLVNLLVNAAQAFETQDVYANRIDISARAEGGRVRITVRDNGPGVAAGLERRIFDPFFTTKAVGKGTGLGLSVSRTIVSTLGGELRLEPTPRGAAFTIELPAVDEAVHDATKQTRGRVLVVDDEIAVLASIKRILEREHDVIVVADPREALRLLEANGEHYDVVVCDISMPHLTGEQLYGRVAESRPAVANRFLFVSGCAVQASPDFLQKIDNARLDKPFVAHKLLGLVRRHVRVNARATMSMRPT